MAVASLVAVAGAAARSERGATPHPGRGRVLFATTGDHSEIRQRVPVATRKWGKRRVVMSLGPRQLPTLRRGDVLRPTAEVQISNTCIVFDARRCIGKRYRFSPREDARIVLASGRGVTGGAHAEPIAEATQLRCHQPRPDRNHHCVLVVEGGSKRVRGVGRLPCRPSACHLNLVLEADHPRARHGDAILVGADRPSGTIRRDKGRLNAIVARGRTRRPASLRSSKPVSSSVPVAPTGARGDRVTLSVRLPRLRRGDVLEARLRQRVSIASVPYSAFIGTRLILATSRHAVVPHGIARRTTGLHGQLTELNGFNCTHGPSAYRDPCLTRKVGALRVRHGSRRHGHALTLYVNSVVGAKAKRTVAAPADRVHVLAGGALTVRRFRGRCTSRRGCAAVHRAGAPAGSSGLAQ